MRAELAALPREALDGLREFEYALRLALDHAERERLFLSGSAAVPPAYRKLVEEYYRSLAGRRP